MKKLSFLSLLLISALLFAPSLASCKSVGSDIKEEGKIRISCTTFSAFDWARQLTYGSKNAEVMLLTDSGVDIHSYVPSVADAARIASSDIIIYVGSASESFIEDMSPKGARLINLLSLLGEDALEIPKSAAGNHENHDNEGGHGEHDEHVWLSLKNARYFCSVICESLCEADSGNSELYKSNCKEYTKALQSLEDEYYTAASKGKAGLMMFADRFPFVYMLNDCKIDYCAAFEGCSTESGATFETVAIMAKLLSESELCCVVITESTDKRLANTIIAASGKENVQIITMNSIQRVSRTDIDKGKTYIDFMKENLVAFKKALG